MGIFWSMTQLRFNVTDQHETLKDSMSKLVLAPMDFSKPELCILDSATADGVSSAMSIDHCLLRCVMLIKVAEASGSVICDPPSSYVTYISAPISLKSVFRQIFPREWLERFSRSLSHSLISSTITPDLVHQPLALLVARQFPMEDVVTNLI